MSRRELLQVGGWGAAGLAAAAALPKGLKAAGDEPIGLALCIALNYQDFDSDAYAGWSLPELPGCLPDAETMKTIATARDFRVKSLINRDATREAVENSILRAAVGNDGKGGLIAGDTLLISYSGHGAQMPDSNRDERDGKDEAWCLFDGLLLDDVLADLWSKFAPGVRIVVVSDSCHSGTMLKVALMQKSKAEIVASAKRHAIRKAKKTREAKPDEAVKKIADKVGTSLDYHGHKDRAVMKPGDKYAHPAVSRALPLEIQNAIRKKHGERYAAEQRALPGEKRSEDRTKAHVQLLSACLDGQLAADIGSNGQFTAVLDEIWDESAQGRQETYETFLNKIAARVESDQID
ncbi:MAG: caspase family protein [Planctomycetales bacterium]|nr:caspase family protein [Planctomycetales bacterium]